MNYTISGRICERESKIGVSGLIVRTYDKERKYGKLLKTTLTDYDGRFKMIFDEAAATDLFKSRPQVFLRIFASPFRFLMDTKEKMQWGAKEEEKIELEIPRKQLGPLSPVRPNGIVEAGVNFSENDLLIEKERMLDVPRLPGWDNGGLVGAPSLPEKLQYIILPLGAKILKVEVHSGQSVHPPIEVNPLPVMAPKQNTEFDAYNANDSEHRFSERESLIQVNPNYLNRTKLYPEELVVQGSIRRKESVQILKMLVRPVQFDPVKHNFVFYPNLRYAIHYDLHDVQFKSSVEKDQTFKQSKLQRLQTFLERDQVFMAKDIGIGVKGVQDFTDIPYVIITDNFTWPEKSKDGKGAPKNDDPQKQSLKVNDLGPVEHFERLAKWKTSRGMRTRVVTIEDIVAGKYGDCTDGNNARDLQEVIRNFVKIANREWGIDYLLLGGSHKIVPMRYLLGYITCSGKYPAWDFSRSSETRKFVNPPPPRGCVLDGNPKKAYLCHDSGLGIPDSSTPLVSSRGKKILFKGTHPKDEIVWYFADEKYLPLLDDKTQKLKEVPHFYGCPEEYQGVTNKGKMICNLIVEGPLVDIDDDYHWALPGRLIPSDLYYASLDLTFSNYYPHDFDSNDNEVYGQFRWDDYVSGEVPIDDFDPDSPDVWVGRAPIESSEEARIFVDKVLTYERLQTPIEGGDAPELVDPSYLKRVVLAVDSSWSLSDAQDHQIWQDQQGNNTVPPEIGKFICMPNNNSLLVHLQPTLVKSLKDWPTVIPHVSARFLDTYHGFGLDINIPYQEFDTSATSPLGWHFVKKQQGKYVLSRELTEYASLTGSAFHIPPKRIVWFDGESRNGNWPYQAENMCRHLSEKFTEFNEHSRYYTDYNGFKNAQPLTVKNIRDALDRGCHFVILEGHGNFNGCSMVWWKESEAARSDFKNRLKYFIAVAGSSCSTAEPDNIYRSLGEKMVLYPDGGAIAYIGNTRTGFDNFNEKKLLWSNLYRYGRLGPASGDQSLPGRYLWFVYERIIYGDPEMPVWTQMPNTYQVVHPDYLELNQGHPFDICVLHNSLPLSLQRVTLMGGWTNSQQEPLILQSRLTDENGIASFDLGPIQQYLKEITVTVVPSRMGNGELNFVPYSAKVPVIKLNHPWRRCTKCQGLFFFRPTCCPNDNGAHEAAPEEYYSLIHDSPDAPAQQGWLRCKKCSSLFFANNKEISGICCDGKEHDGKGSLKYSLSYISRSDPFRGRPLWHWCDKCQVLHYVNGSTTGPCYKKGENHNAGGTSYFVHIHY